MRYDSLEYNTQTVEEVGPLEYRLEISLTDRREFTWREFLDSTEVKRKWSHWAYIALGQSFEFCGLFREPGRKRECPVPFSALLIHPANAPFVADKPLEVLLTERMAYTGTLYDTKVGLYGKGGKYGLAREEYEESHPGYVREQLFCIDLWEKPTEREKIPLTQWLLNLRSDKLLTCFSRVKVTVNGDTPVENCGEYVYRENHGMEEEGWRAETDKIFMRKYSDGRQTFCRESFWRDIETDTAYRVFTEAELLPGEKDRDSLIAAMETIPWWSPKEAKAAMGTFYNWQDAEFLARRRENLESQMTALPSDRASRALETVIEQQKRMK